jgi:hypothetical protein
MTTPQTPAQIHAAAVRRHIASLPRREYRPLCRPDRD